MAYPSYKEIEEPLLREIQKQGGCVPARELYTPLAEHFGLSPEDRERKRPGRNEAIWDNMVRWARNELCEAGELENPQRGMWKITSQGLQRISQAGASPAAAPAPIQPVRARTAAALSFTDAAEKVLDRFAGERPMSYRDITRKALALGLIGTAGKTPEATLRSAIAVEIERHERRGERPRFVRYERGFIGLSRWGRSGLAYEVEQHNRKIHRELLARVREMPPEKFETLIGTLLAKIGFDEVQVTARSGDGGIDVRGTLVVGGVIRTRMAVQVKRWKPNVLAPTVQQVRGSLGAHEQGLIITTSDFSQGARQEAERSDATPVALMNGEEMVGLLVEHNIGVRRVPADLLDPTNLLEEG